VAVESEGETVDIRAFRGSRKASVYRDHVLGEERFARVVATAAEQGLTVLGSLDEHGPRELDKAASMRLAEELTQLRSSGALVELDDDLVAIAELARWCAHAGEDAWLRTERP
jgi:hypothetical protein